jgi:PAS domain S-box-containing protein
MKNDREKNKSENWDNTLDSLELLLHRMMFRIRQSLELSAILSGTVAEVREFLDTDRVKIYQFEDDGSGQVVAESRQTQRLPSLLGQHFPAEDIPEEARILYLQTRQRTFVNISRQEIGISPLNCSETGKYLKLEGIEFRAVDPCHVEYLTAMGVQSSLVVPILHSDCLWGLLVSHHSLPRQVTEKELQVVQLVADQVSIAIAHSSLLSQTRAQAQQEATINRVAKLLHSMTEIQIQQALEETVSALQGSGGRVYIFQGVSEACAECDRDVAEMFTCGEQPILKSKVVQGREGEEQENKIIGSSTIALETNPEWQKWLEKKVKDNNNNPILSIEDVEKASLPSELVSAFLSARIKSLLIIRLQYRQHLLGYLIIFRPSINIETLWARRFDRDDPRNFLPIQSFETWKELKEGQARAWTNSEIELAHILGSHFGMAIHQYQLYQKVRCLNVDLERDIDDRKQAEAKISALNAELEKRVEERTIQLQQTNLELLHEIEERKQAKALLERISHQQELILNSAGEGIYGLNLQRKVTFINPAAAEMLGYEVKELHDRYIDRILNHSNSEGKKYPPEENPIYTTIQTGTIHHVSDDLFYRRNGTNFPVEYVSTPIQENGKIVGAVVIFKDITERQIVERMKDEFVSVVSHELRTPLTSIRSSLGILISGLLKDRPDKSQRMLEIAFENSNRLVRLINDILDLERIKSGKTTTEHQICNAADLMTKAVEVMQAMADKAKIKISFKPLSIELKADSDRIIQALTNLLSNAIKFSPPQTTINLTAELQDERTVLFKLQDRGRGIPEYKLEAIFDRFQQVDATDSRHQGGTGLGLAICRNIVEQHGGNIWVESILDKGSTFYFTLPISD